jgi:hypothetical protein
VDFAVAVVWKYMDDEGGYAALTTYYAFGPLFPLTVTDGIRDASSHIESMSSDCPNTRAPAVDGARSAFVPSR